jgi:hypothetical protein
MNKPTLRIHTHWQVTQSHPAIQNLPKSMSAPTHSRQESAANLKENNSDGNERQCTTRGIKHWGFKWLYKILPRIKFGVNGQESSPQSPTISYRQPLSRMSTIPACIFKK